MKMWEIFDKPVPPKKPVIFGRFIPDWKNYEDDARGQWVLVLTNNKNEYAELHVGSDGKLNCQVNGNYTLNSDSIKDLEQNLNQLGLTKFDGYDHF